MKTTNSRQAALFLSSLCLLALCGCARSLVKTTIHEDGSWSRSLKFTALRHDKPGAMTGGPSLQQTFVLPQGAAWKTRTEKDKDNVSYIAETDLRPGQAQSHDVVIRGSKNTPVLVNDATVHEVSPGTWEYRETLHWAGPPNETMHLDDPEVLAHFKAALPTDLATDANARDVAKAMLPGVWQALWGPPEPLVGQLITHPDLGENLLAQHLGKSLDAALRAKFGNRLTDAQRLDVERKILTSFVSEVQSHGKPGGDDAPPADNAASSGKDDAQPVAMTFVAQVPGEIVSTNGEQNPVTREVFWGLYPEAAQLGDVTLTVTYKIGK